MFDYRLEHIMSYTATLGDHEVIGRCRKAYVGTCL
jgi:hypothetical protein